MGGIDRTVLTILSDFATPVDDIYIITFYYRDTFFVQSILLNLIFFLSKCTEEVDHFSHANITLAHKTRISLTLIPGQSIH